MYVKRTLVIAVAIVALGCQPTIVEWEEPTGIATTLPADARLNLVRDSAAFVPARLTTSPLDPPDACAGSVRVAGHPGKPLHAVWWALKTDRTADLLAARSDNDGYSWRPTVPVDTTDISRTGCDRFPPAIAVDENTGYIHIVYSLENETGAGVFFSHSMENGMLYHAPVPIVFGARTSAADVAAQRSRVVVAYEDPNLREQSAGRIALALSNTDGHIFEHRIPVTPGGAAVSAPAVAIEGEKVAVAWREGGGKQHVRIGTLTPRS